MNKPQSLSRIILFDCVSFIIIALLAVFVALSIAETARCELGFEYFLGDTEIGVVRSPSDFSDTAGALERRVSEETGFEYGIEDGVRIKIVNVSDDTFATNAELEDAILSAISGDVTDAYSLYLNGEFVGSAKSRETLVRVVEQLEQNKLASIGDDGVSSVSLESGVEIKNGLCLTKQIKSDSEMLLALTGSSRVIETAPDAADDDTHSKDILSYGFIPVMTYAAAPTAASADAASMDATAATASTSTDMTSGTTSATRAMNRVSVADIEYGINRVNPAVAAQETSADSLVYSITRVEYATETIPHDTEYIDSTWYYVGTEAVNTYGSDGSRDVVYNVSYIDGVETGREVVSSVITRQPITEIIVRGTSAKPSSTPSGTFIWPSRTHYVTSGFGSRTLFSGYDYHLGIDIGASYGSAVLASDGGTVTYAGWSYSYGYHVIISHGGKYSTLYAHLSKINVSYGKKVYQGETIGLVGSSGVTTGAHLHFEIRQYGSVVNPLKYLP